MNTGYLLRNKILGSENGDEANHAGHIAYVPEGESNHIIDLTSTENNLKTNLKKGVKRKHGSETVQKQKQQ